MLKKQKLQYSLEVVYEKLMLVQRRIPYKSEEARVPLLELCKEFEDKIEKILEEMLRVEII